LTRSYPNSSIYLPLSHGCNDPCRIIRGDTTSSAAWWFSYKLDAGITEAAIFAFNDHQDKERTRGFDVYVSADNRKWTKVEPTYSTKDDLLMTADPSRKWILRTYKVTGIDKSNKYLKIQFTAMDGEQYEPLIGRVRINNINKMEDPYRNLEGRAAKTFYVSTAGVEGNDGLSPECPLHPDVLHTRYFQPGDKILFKSGETMLGSGIKLSGFGTASKRVTVSTYGGSAPAKLATRGDQTRSKLEVYIDCVTIENLEISNPLGRVGLTVGPGHAGANKGIIIQNCTFKDVNKNADTFVFESGAVQIAASGGEPTWFEDLVVRNNTIHNVARIGVFVTSSWAERTNCVNGEYKNGNEQWYANKNVSLTGNTLTDVQGDGLLIIGCNGARIENNFANNTYCVNESTLKKHKATGLTTSVAVMWTQNVDKGYVQYNDVGYTNLPDHANGGADGTPFDIDGLCTNHFIRYNYSHNNEGGFILLCEFPPSFLSATWQSMLKETTHQIGFNLSVNDGCKPGYAVFIVTSTLAQMNIVNNTFITRSGSTSLLMATETVMTGYTFKNNIFYGASTCNIGSCYGASQFVFDNNVFCGGTLSYGNGITVTNTKNVDPNFANASFNSPNSSQNLRSQAIAAFTPRNKISGAYTNVNGGGKDINGSSFSSAFYGCVKY